MAGIALTYRLIGLRVESSVVVVVAVDRLDWVVIVVMAVGGWVRREGNAETEICKRGRRRKIQRQARWTRTGLDRFRTRRLKSLNRLREFSARSKPEMDIWN